MKYEFFSAIKDSPNNFQKNQNSCSTFAAVDFTRMHVHDYSLLTKSAEVLRHKIITIIIKLLTMQHRILVCNSAIFKPCFSKPFKEIKPKQDIKSNKSSRSQMLLKKGVLKNFVRFTGKHLCWSLFD